MQRNRISPYNHTTGWQISEFILQCLNIYNSTYVIVIKLIHTGKSLSKALIFPLTNPQYDDRWFIELQVQYIKIPSSNMGRRCSVQKLFLTFRTIFVHNMFFPCSAKRRASDKDLPVLFSCVTIATSRVNLINISIWPKF